MTPTKDSIAEALQTARDRVELMELNERLTEAEAEARGREMAANIVPTLRESVYAGIDQLVSPRDIFANLPAGASTYSGILDQPTDKEDTRDGDNAPFWRNTHEHQQLQGLCRYLTTAHEAGSTMLDRLVDYTVHVGMNYQVEARKGVEPPKELIAEAQAAVDDVLDQNKWRGDGEGRALAAMHGCGEMRLHVHEPVKGEVEIEQVLPQHICEPQKEDVSALEHALNRQRRFNLYGASWKYGVVTDPRRTHVPLGYFYDPDHTGVNWEFWPAEEVVEVKLNVSRKVKRGLSDYYPVARLMQHLLPLPSNLAIAASIQASIALIREMDPKAGGGVQRQGTTGSVVSMGSTVEIVENRPGQIIDSKGVKHQSGPVGNNQAEALIEVLQMGYRLVGNRFAFPEYMSTANARNNNRASGETAETPFVRATERKQKRLIGASQEALWIALSIMARRGRFKRWSIATVDQLKKLLIIKIEPPEVQTKDRKAEAARFAVMVKGRAMSRQTWSEKAGLDWDVERSRIEEEDAQELDRQKTASDTLGPPEPMADPKPGNQGKVKEQAEDRDTRIKRAAELLWEGYP